MRAERGQWQQHMKHARMSKEGTTNAKSITVIITVIITVTIMIVLLFWLVSLH